MAGAGRVWRGGRTGAVRINHGGHGEHEGGLDWDCLSRGAEDRVEQGVPALMWWAFFAPGQHALDVLLPFLSLPFSFMMTTWRGLFLCAVMMGAGRADAQEAGARRRCQMRSPLQQGNRPPPRST